MKRRFAAVLLGIALVLSACGNSAPGITEQAGIADDMAKIEVVTKAGELLSNLDKIKLDEMSATYSLEISGLTSSAYNDGAFADGADFSISSEGSFAMSGSVSHDVSTIRESYYVPVEDSDEPAEASYEGTEEHYSVFSVDSLSNDDEEVFYQYFYSNDGSGWEKSSWSYEKSTLEALRESKIYTDLEIAGDFSGAQVSTEDGYDVVSVELPGRIVAGIGGSLTSEYAAYMLSLAKVDSGIPVVFYFKGGDLSRIYADYSGSIPAADDFGIITRFRMDIAMNDGSPEVSVPDEIMKEALDTGYGGTGYTYEELLESSAGSVVTNEDSIFAVLTGEEYDELPSREEIISLSNGVLDLSMDEDLIDLCGYIGVCESSESFAHYYLGESWEDASDLVKKACAVVYKAGWVEPELFPAHGVEIEELEAVLR